MALLKHAAQPSTYMTMYASNANDGNALGGGSCTLSHLEPFWSVDLGEPMNVDRVCVTNDNHPTNGLS